MKHLAASLLLWAAGLQALPLAPAPTPPAAGVQPAVGALLPLDLPFTDSAGRAVTLRESFGDRPVLLVLGYYRCAQLCGLLMQGLLEGLHGLPARNYRLLRVSIDPTETPADARAREAVDLAYARHLGGEPPTLQLLTGPSAALLARRVGYRYERSDDAGFAHPAVAFVVTPQGRISSALNGIRFEPAELRLALSLAAEGRTRPSLGDRIALLCAHFDPRLGRHSAAVLHGLQVTGVALALGLALLFWRQRPAS